MTEHQKELPREDEVTEQSRELTSTIGPILRDAREAIGMTVDDVASRLHLRPTLVEDIEADRFENIASATYARGYVRNFARIVGADEALVMACLEQQVPSEAEPAMQSFSRKTTQKARDSRLMLVTWLIAFVLLALLVIWWVQKNTDSTGLDLSRPSVEEVAAAEELGGEAAGVPLVDTAAQTTQNPVNEGDIAPAQDEVLSSGPQTEVSPTPAAVAVDATPQTQSQEQIQTNEPAVDSAVKPGADTENRVDLSVNLSGDCWMKVEDATGKVLIHGVKSAGREMNVTGVPPFNLVIGAPQVVTLNYNGENVSLADYPSGKVARFTLPRG